MTTKTTPSGASAKSSDTATGSDTTSLPNSSNSTMPSSDSKKRWRQAKSVMEFTSQVNAVANKVLNGEIDLDTARTFSALARVVASGVNAEVSRSRFLKAAPELCFAELDDLTEGGEE